MHCRFLLSFTSLGNVRRARRAATRLGLEAHFTFTSEFPHYLLSAEGQLDEGEFRWCSRALKTIAETLGGEYEGHERELGERAGIR